VSEETKPEEHADKAAAVPEGAAASSSAGAADPKPLQFEKAEFDDAPAAPMCTNCSQPVASSYYQVGTAIVCAACRDVVVRALESGKADKRFFRAALRGLGAATLGAIVWYAIREATGYELGIVAIGIGILVGVTVKRGSGGFGGRRYQALAMVLTYVSITLANVPPILKVVADSAGAASAKSSAASGTAPAEPTATPTEPPAPSALPTAPPGHEQDGASAQPPGLLGLLWAVLSLCVMVLLLAFAAPFLAGFENLIGILIIGIGLYEAWKITRHEPPQIQGPFEVKSARSSAADRAA
jgi:hypothetical protein